MSDNFNLPLVTPPAIFLEVIKVVLLILFEVTEFIILNSEHMSN